MTPNIMINQTDNSPPKRWLRLNNLIQIVKPGEIFSNRDCWTRTNDPLVPNQVRYQTALNPEYEKLGSDLIFTDILIQTTVILSQMWETNIPKGPPCLGCDPT